METKYFRQKDFNQFDWDRLKHGEYATNGENYSFAEGGPNYIGGEGWHITVFDLSEGINEVWELPTVISRFINWMEKNGANNKINEIKAILEIK